MIPAPLLLVWRYRKLAGYALAAVAAVWLIWAQIAAYGSRREDAGRAAVQELWEADTAARQKTTDKAIADAKAREDAAKAANVEILQDANEKLTAIAADRTSLSGLLRAARDQVRSLTSAEATDITLADVAARVAARQREIDAAYDAYDSACRRDAVRLGALQAEIRPQM